MEKKAMIFAAIVVIIIVAAGALLLLGPEKKTEGFDPITYYMTGESGVIYHIHPEIDIEILGERRTVPAEIGIENFGMRVIHTHTTDGIIHVESPVVQEFHLKHFFIIWGKNFNSTCIFDYCVDEDHTLTFTVNEQPNSEYENLPLRDKDRIKIAYAAKL